VPGALRLDAAALFGGTVIGAVPGQCAHRPAS